MLQRKLPWLAACLIMPTVAWAADAAPAANVPKPAAAAPAAPAAPGAKPAAAAPTAAAATPAAAVPAAAAQPAAEELAQDPAALEKQFREGLNYYHDNNFRDAAAVFYSYLSHSTSTDENYGWSQYFLGESLASLGYWHAGTIYLYLVAKTRSQPEVLNETLARLESISRLRPFDESLVYQDLIYDSDFGVLPPVLNSWVQYVQGLYDYLNGNTEWGEKHFKQIDKASPYALEAQYVRAVNAVREKHDDEATDAFASITDSSVKSVATKNRSRLALARMLFDRGYYTDAIGLYDKVDQVDLSYEQALILGEKAWSAYYLRDYTRALGFLHALGAPSYENYFLPEVYLLRGLVFKDLCHYLSAKNVVRAFRFKYGRSIEQLMQRQPMEQIGRIRQAATAHGSISRRTRFLQSLRHELDALDDEGGAWESSGLLTYLRSVYSKSLIDHTGRWRDEFKRAGDAVALRLLDTAEQINLLDYEVSMDIYKPFDPKTAKAPETEHVMPDSTHNVLYEFDGEYWNDELRGYQYFITSQCFGREE